MSVRARIVPVAAFSAHGSCRGNYREHDGRAAPVAVPTSVTVTAAGPSPINESVMVSPSAAYPYGTAMTVGVGGSLI